VRVYLTLFLTACWLVVPAQPKELTGFLKDAATGEPLHGAHIQNMTTRMVTTSSVNGTFRMPVTAGDSIRITFVGYETYAFAVKPAHIEQAQPIDLEPAQVALDDVVVTPLPDYWRFKQMVADTDPPKDSVMTFDLPQVTAQYFYDPRDEPAGQRNLHAPGIGFGFNITSRKENKELKARHC